MRRLAFLICAGLVVAGCAATEEGPRAANNKLYEAVAGQTISVIDSRTHATDRRLPLGVPSSDWKHLYSIASASLVDTDPQTGSTLGTLNLGGNYKLPPATANGIPGGLSRNGSWLVVESSTGTSTRMLLIDTVSLKVYRQVDLQGTFHFDAVSDDGMRLYMIQILNSREYYVRLYDLVLGQLDENIVVDKSDGNQAMTGLRLSGLATPGGGWLFSMYVRSQENPFVHALSLGGPFAFCLDLPGGGYNSNQAEMQWSLAMSPDGTRLYAANPATGMVATISNGDNSAPAILRTARFDNPGAESSWRSGANAAVVSKDGSRLVVAGSSGVAWIDTSNLRLRDHTLSGWHVSTIGLSPDGQTLYAVSDRGRVAEVSMSSATVINEFDAEGAPMALMRVAAS